MSIFKRLKSTDKLTVKTKIIEEIVTINSPRVLTAKQLAQRELLSEEKNIEVFRKHFIEKCSINKHEKRAKSKRKGMKVVTKIKRKIIWRKKYME
jgi:hypothetical protein